MTTPHPSALFERLPDGRQTFSDAIQKAIASRDYERLRVSMSDGQPLDLLVRLVKDSKVLVVFGQDAIVRRRHTLPRFFRWSWARGKSYSAIFLNDPTLYINNEIEGGWFQGTANTDYMRETADFIFEIARHLELPERHIVFFGASAGGFTSAIMASMAGANALLDIPQFDLLSYHIDDARTRLLNTCYGDGPSYDHFRHRLSVIDSMMTNDSWPKRLWIVQNLCDSRHVNGQFIPFVSKFVCEVTGRGIPIDFRIISSIRFSPIRGGHIPNDETEMISLIHDMVTISRTDPAITDVDSTP